MKQKRTNLIETKNTAFLTATEKEISNSAKHGLHCCNVRCKDTKGYCTRTFFDHKALTKHKIAVNNGEDEHNFPSSSVFTKLAVDIQSGKYALCLACGSMTNRDEAVAIALHIKNGGMLRDHEAVQEGGLSQLLCLPGAYRRNNKTLKKKRFEASWELVLDLLGKHTT